MKLRNKKTGEIINLLRGELSDDCGDTIVLKPNDDHEFCYRYNSLTELNEEWEDYEEPKDHWYIDYRGYVYVLDPKSVPNYSREAKQIGNYFETREQAEEAVEKLKAWKRLKDNGFRFYDWKDEPTYRVAFDWNKDIKVQEVQDDLDLLFGGEE